MAELRRLPPGRSGRLWLAARIAAAHRAADLHDRKLRALLDETDRLGRRAVSARHAWQRDWREAQLWQLCAAMLGGERDLRLTAPPGWAELGISWRSVMGTTYPISATCALPEPGQADRGPGTAAGVAAAAASGQALRSAAELGAIEAGRQALEAEIANTRRRLRAIARRWIPRLEAALVDLNQELEEAERAGTVRLLRALGSLA
jgi:V/A-type H+-transporting ATPase subunit D